MYTDTIYGLTSFLRKLCMLLRLPRSANFEATPITIKLVSDDKTISTHADTPAHKHTKYTITAWKQKSKSKPITSFFSAKTATKQTRGVSQKHLEMHVTEPEGKVEKMDVDTGDTQPAAGLATSEQRIEPPIVLPCCWTRAQWTYFKDTYPWLYVQKGCLGCLTCTDAVMSGLGSQLPLLSSEWSSGAVTSQATNKNFQQKQLRKKVTVTK